MTAHKYPSRYPIGTHWATDKGWEIMDRLKPGAIPDETRYFLAGIIAGTLMGMQQDPMNMEREWKAKHDREQK